MPHIDAEDVGSRYWLWRFLKEDQNRGYWKWEGHDNIALLTGGKVSDVYVNCTSLHARADLLAEVMRHFIFSDWRTAISETSTFAEIAKSIDCIVGPSFGAIQMVHEAVKFLNELPHNLGAETHVCELAIGEQLTRGANKTMTTQRFDIKPHSRILLLDDVISTGSSLVSIAQEISLRCPSVTYFPIAFCLADRLQGTLDLGTPQGHKVTTHGYIQVDGNVWNKEDVPGHLKECGHMRPKPCWNALNTQMLEVAQ